MSPHAEHFRQPAEWEPHAACWLAWPSDGELWQDHLAPARAEFTALCEAIGPGEALEVLVPDATQEQMARAALQRARPRFHRIPFGDIWMRDIAPIFVRAPSSAVAAVRFRFNGWGGKYVLPHDDQVAASVAAASRLKTFTCDFVLEGGSVDVDGEGTCLTTRQCLLNANRAPNADPQRVEAGLREALGVERVLWLDEGLLNDHTDGHVDTVARFVRPAVVVCMAPNGSDDPNRHVLEDIAARLHSFVDARGRTLEVVQIPSPGRVVDGEGRVMPASYVNFYIGNEAVAVPTYGVPSDAAAVAGVARLFPKRRTVGLSARAILSGGGAFHCITQQQPAGESA
jgi:agmatine deiminase